MDPNLIHLDWERTFEAMMMVIILSFIVERALAIVFENRIYIEFLDRDGLKEMIAFGVAVTICWVWKFDMVSMLILTEKTTVPGYIITGLVIAGGSKASIKLFHDLLNVKSTGFEMRHEIKADKAANNAEKFQALAVDAANLLTAERAATSAKHAADVARMEYNKSGSTFAKESADRALKAATSAATAAKKLKVNT